MGWIDARLIVARFSKPRERSKTSTGAEYCTNGIGPTNSKRRPAIATIRQLLLTCSHCPSLARFGKPSDYQPSERSKPSTGAEYFHQWHETNLLKTKASHASHTNDANQAHHSPIVTHLFAFAFALSVWKTERLWRATLYQTTILVELNVGGPTGAGTLRGRSRDRVPLRGSGPVRICHPAHAGLLVAVCNAPCDRRSRYSTESNFV